MPLLLLLCLLLACVPVPWPASPLGIGPGGALLAAVTYVAGLAVAAALLARTVAGRLSRPAGHEFAVRAYARGRLWHLGATLVGFLVLLYLLGWGSAVQGWCARPTPTGHTPSLGPPDTWPGSELLVLAPVPLALALSWLSFYDAERLLLVSARGAGTALPFGGRLGYLAFQARQNLALVMLPVLTLVVAAGLRRAFPAIAEGPVGQVAGLLPVPVLMVFMPWVLRGVLGLRPLPPGELADRLQAAARRLDCRLSGVLVWDTRQGVVNAMVVGVVPWLRYVLLTDRLMRDLTPEEVEAVFGHEAGHVRHRHVITYVAFLGLSLAVLGGLWVALGMWLESWPAVRDWLERGGPEVEGWLVLPLLATLGVYLFVVFGWLSRRCERQADVFGCRAVSCGRPDCDGHGPDTPLPAGARLCPTGVRTFISALEKVAALNGVSRGRPGYLQAWQHSTIARRVAFLEGLLIDPGREAAFQRAVSQLKWGLLATLACLAAVLGWWVGLDRLAAL
jgi:Zn-dependent protease with chaperone function